MKKLIFIALFLLLFTPNVFGATRTISDAGGNWGDTTTWAEGAVPTASDDVVAQADGTSGQVTITAAAVCKTANFTNYTNTLTHNTGISLTVSGSLTLVAGMTYSPADATASITINATGTLTTGSKTLGNLTFNKSGGTLTIGDNLTFIASKSCVFTITAGTVDLNGKTISGNSSINRLLIKSNTIGTAAAITVSAGTFANADFRDINFNNGGANLDLSAITGGSGDCGGNGMTGGGTLTLTATDNWYWQTTGAGTYNWSDATYWFTATNGGGDSGDVRGFPPLPQDNCYFDADSVTGATTVDQDMPRMCKTLDFTGVDAINLHMDNVHQTIYGGLTLVNNVTLTRGATYVLYLEGRGSFTLTSAGKNLRLLYVYMYGGTLTLQDSLNLTLSGSPAGWGVLRLYNGTLDANNYDIAAYAIQTYGPATRALIMGSGTWTVGGSTNAGWYMDSATGLSINCGTSTVAFTDTLSPNKSFTGQGFTYNNVSITGGGTGAIIFSGSNTFNTITINAPKTITFTFGTTQTVSSFVAVGSAGNIITINSSTAGSLATLSDSAGNNIVRYCSIQDSTAGGGAVWDASNNCVNVSGNKGWTFFDAFLMAGD